MCSPDLSVLSGAAYFTKIFHIVNGKPENFSYSANVSTACASKARSSAARESATQDRERHPWASEHRERHTEGAGTGRLAGSDTVRRVRRKMAE